MIRHLSSSSSSLEVDECLSTICRWVSTTCRWVKTSFRWVEVSKTSLLLRCSDVLCFRVDDLGVVPVDLERRMSQSWEECRRCEGAPPILVRSTSEGFCRVDIWKWKLQVTNYKLQVTSYKLQVTSKKSTSGNKDFTIFSEYGYLLWEVWVLSYGILFLSRD